MKRHTLRRSLLGGIVASTALLATACPGGGGGIPLINWEFKATQVTVNDAQDEVRVFGACVAIPNCNDEPYIIQVATRVKVGGGAGNASGFVVSTRDVNPENVSAGTTVALTGAAQGSAVYNGIDALDILDLLDANRHMEVLVTYTWVMEEDTVPVNTAANDVKDILVTALNTTLATGTLPSDPNAIVQLILDNLGNAFTLLLSNIPLFGLGDDVGGGAFDIGIGAKGALGGIIDATIGTATASFPIPVVSLPPDIKHVNIYSMSGTKTFPGEAFNQYGDGVHTYDFQTNQV